MFCKSCGKKIDNDSTFCSFCGTKQSSELKPQVQSGTIQSNNTSEQVHKNDPLSTNSSNPIRQSKYDPIYEKEDEASVIGIVLLVIALIFTIVGPMQFESRESYGQFLAMTAIVSLVLRVFVTVWIVNMAVRQNRETLGWGVFAFLLPSIALIIIGTRKKLFANIQIMAGLDNEQNSKVLSDQAHAFYDENKYLECIRFAEKAIELHPENEIPKEILKKSKVAFAEVNNASSSIRTTHNETLDGTSLKIVSKFNHTTGSLVFIDDLPAPDGTYTYKDGGKMIAKNGEIHASITIGKFKKVMIEMTQGGWPSKGDLVFLENGASAPTGNYNQGFMRGTIIVEDGTFLSW